jgi:hypothetical protein
MFVPQAHLAPCPDDHVAFAGITKSLLGGNSHCPASFCPCGVLRFVLDGMAAEVSFELPPARFASFLVGEPKAFPFIVQRRLLSVTGLLWVFWLGMGVSWSSWWFGEERKREKKREGYQREVWRDAQRMAYTKERQKKS